MANEVSCLCQKLFNENIDCVDPTFLNLESSQKIELLSQLLDMV